MERTAEPLHQLGHLRLQLSTAPLELGGNFQPLKSTVQPDIAVSSSMHMGFKMLHGFVKVPSYILHLLKYLSAITLSQDVCLT